jgi:hypothetical protein
MVIVTISNSFQATGFVIFGYPPFFFQLGKNGTHCLVKGRVSVFKDWR